MPFSRLQRVLRLRRMGFRLAKSVGVIWIPSLLIATIATTATAAVIIKDDHGGNIGVYWSRYAALRDMGQEIIIDGICSSACTLVLGMVPHDRICVTQNALLGFHAAWRPGFLGVKAINEPGTRTLLSFYPPPIRDWIARHGGLGSETIYLSGPELRAVYRECRNQGGHLS
jgi:hypothetical protein